MYFKGEKEKAEEYLLKGATLNSKIGSQFFMLWPIFFSDITTIRRVNCIKPKLIIDKP